MADTITLLLLGVGQVAFAIAARARWSNTLIGTTRDADRTAELQRAGIEPLVVPSPVASADAKILISRAAEGAHVLVSFPPDGESDRRLSSLCANASRIAYISSTAVYGERRGRVDDSTPVDPSTPQARARIEAENIWRSKGAIVLRAPALYGPDSGPHVRLRRGDYRLPGDGEGHVSRIHLFDLATIVMAAFEESAPGTTYVLGDLEPTTHRQAVEWLCTRLRLPLPDSEPLASAHYTARSDRCVDASRVLSKLGVTLRYPSFREGFEACLSGATGQAS